MAGTVSGLHVFAADTGPEPLSLLDVNYSALQTSLNALITYANYYVDSGSAGAVIVSVNSPQAVAYTDGLTLQVKIAASNTSAGATINVNGLGVKNIVNPDGSTLAIGQLVANGIAQLQYSAIAGNFQLVGGGVGGSLGNALFANGTAAAPSIAFTNSTGTGFYRAGVDILGVSTAGVQRVQINASGNVTINAPSSGTALTVNGLQSTHTQFLGPNTGAGWNLNFFDTTASSARGFIGIGTNTVSGVALTDFGIAPGPGGSVVIGTANGAAIGTRFGQNGNVTINTPSSGSSITVNALANNSAALFQGPAGAGGVQGVNVSWFDTTNSTFRGFMGFGTSGVTGAGIADLGIAAGPAGRLLIGTANGAAIGTIFSAGGNVTINAPISGDSLTSTAVANNNAAALVAPNTASQSFGLLITAGTNSSDRGLGVRNAAGTFQFQVRGDGAILGLGPVAASLVDMTPDTGTFTATYTGFTANPTATATWARIGKLCMLQIPAATATSNATTFTVTGLPAAIQPATLTQWLSVSVVQDNGNPTTLGAAVITAGSGTIQFALNTNLSTWTNVNTKGLPHPITLCYLLN